MTDVTKRYQKTVPSLFKPSVNPVIKALIEALAERDEEIRDQIKNAEDQQFISSATGTYLTKAADSLGVSRPLNMGLRDSAFQDLVPNLTFKPKQIKKAFYETAEVFWGPLISRANITTANSATFNISNGDELLVTIDGGSQQSIVVRSGDVASAGAATAAELVAIFGRISGATASISEDGLTGDLFVNLRTDTYGPTGSVEIHTCSMVGSSKVDFEVKETQILDQAQRFVVYQINPNHLKIEVPITVPLEHDTLEGGHYFHADGTLESAVAPANGIWQGSFFYNPNGVYQDFTISNVVTDLVTTINEGDVLTSIEVTDASDFQSSGTGYLMFGFGLVQEGPVFFRGVPNDAVILLDPTYQFLDDHSAGVKINLLRSRLPHNPVITGEDLAIYFSSPVEARSTVTDTVFTRLNAAGVVLEFITNPPDFEYILTNPYA